MLNPITEKRIYFLAYILIWVMIAIIQMIILMLFFDIPFLPAFSDGLIVNTFHALIGLAIWFPVRFNPVSAKEILNPLAAIFVTGMLAITFWVTIPYFILKSLFSQNAEYLSFLESSVPNRIITDSLLYIVLVLVYSLIVYSSNLKDKISEEANLKTLIREAELNMLKAQINPHFLFNALNSISLLTKKDATRAREMIIKLSDYLRYSLRFGQDSMITFQEELENMERYLDIEKIRFGEKLQYTKDINEDSLNHMLPNMILQPLVENAIKHGVYESVDPILIKISSSRMGPDLIIELENDYDPENIPRKGAGIGIKNISSRLHLLYNRLDLLSYKGDKRKFKVRLKIPS